MRLCKILDTNFGELPFHALGWITLLSRTTSLRPYVHQDGVDYYDDSEHEGQGSISCGSKTRCGRSENQHLKEQDHDPGQLHRCTRSHENAPHERGADAKGDLRDRSAAGLEAPIAQGNQSAQL